MKTFFLLSFLLNTTLLIAQTHSFEYLFISKEYLTNKTLKSNSKVVVKKNSPVRLYQMTFNPSTESSSPQSGTFVLKGDNYEYTAYSENGNKFMIKDLIQSKYYTLTDTPLFNWIFSNETKKVDNIILNKATTNFRGRNYTAWYQKNKELKVAPWKFAGIPGIVFEVSDDSDDYSWKLTKQEITKDIITNPFPKETEFITYDRYPKLRYALSAQLEEALSRNPNRTLFEQPRVDLEKKFENEKK